MKEKIPLKDVTFLVPIRIESLERLENLKAATDNILGNFDTNIIILEASHKKNEIMRMCISPEIEIHFEEDEDPVFHRTRYINQLTMLAPTPIIAVWDSDVIVRPEQILLSVKIIRTANVSFVYPYDGMFVDTGREMRDAFLMSNDVKVLLERMERMFPLYGYNASGGGFFADKAAYCAAGMENEGFYGWGYEDGERVKRWGILEMSYTRVPGPMFHLSHPRGLNSGFRPDEDTRNSLREMLRICRMSKEELQKEVQTWSTKTKSLMHA